MSTTIIEHFDWLLTRSVTVWMDLSSFPPELFDEETVFEPNILQYLNHEEHVIIFKREAQASVLKMIKREFECFK